MVFELQMKFWGKFKLDKNERSFATIQMVIQRAG